MSETSKLPKGQIKTDKELITVQDVEEVIKKALGSNYRVIDYHVKSFCDGKLGFLAAHRHLVITVEKDNFRATHTFFVKSVPYDIQTQTALIEESNAFYKETNFFKHIMPKLLRELTDKSWIAQCYLVKHDVLVFENLASKNFSLSNMHLALDTLKSGISVLGKFHASCILAEKRLGKSFNEIYPDLLKESMFTRTSKFYTWITTSIDANVAVAKYLGLKHENIRRISDLIFELVRLSETKRNVINHGDTKSFNFMFDNSQPPNCILLDYQLTRYVPAMIDVVQFIYLNTRRIVRETFAEELLRVYYEAHCETLKNSELDVPVPNYSDVSQEYHDMKLIGMITASVYTPIHFLGEKKIAELTTDSDGFAKFLFEDRIDLTFNEMDTNPTYKEILTEVITEISEISDDLFA